MNERQRHDHLGTWARGAVRAAIFGGDRLGRLAADLAVRALEAWKQGGDDVLETLISCDAVPRDTVRRHLLRNDREPLRGLSARERLKAVDAKIERLGLGMAMRPVGARRYLAWVLGRAVATGDDQAGRVVAALALASLARIEDGDTERRPPTLEQADFSAAFPVMAAFRLNGAMAELEKILAPPELPSAIHAVVQGVFDGTSEESDAEYVRRVRALTTPAAIAACRTKQRPRGRPLKPDSQVERVIRFVSTSKRFWSAKQLQAQPALSDVKRMRNVLADAVRRFPERITRRPDESGDVTYGPPPRSPTR